MFRIPTGISADSYHAFTAMYTTAYGQSRLFVVARMKAAKVSLSVIVVAAAVLPQRLALAVEAVAR